MKVIHMKTATIALWNRIRSQRKSAQFVLACVLLLCFLILLSWSAAVCVQFPVLLWLREDACKVWKEHYGQGTEPSPSDLSWWQRACLIEKDWNSMDYECRDTRLMGNWPVCFDEPYSPVKKGKACIVYSFGIAYDFRFDDAMAHHNCTVYSFDPSMDVADHQRSKNVFFKKIGIGAKDDDSFSPRADGYAKASDRWKIMTLSSIMKSLNHDKGKVTLVKMDVESSEWPILKNLLEENILPSLPQILIEWHLFTDQPSRSTYEDLHNDYNKFKSLGFKKFWMRNEGNNHWLPKMETQAETAWVNSKYRPTTG